MFKKILVPVDGTSTCNKSLEYAKVLAKNFDAELVLFNAQELSPSIAWVNDPVAYQQIVVDPDKIAKEILNKALKCFEGTELNITTAFAIGDPAHAILDHCEEMGCDLILLSTHSNTALKRFLLGSVTDKIVHHAKVSVFVVR